MRKWMQVVVSVYECEDLCVGVWVCCECVCV